jgi:hypothetical protein
MRLEGLKAVFILFFPWAVYGDDDDTMMDRAMMEMHDGLDFDYYGLNRTMRNCCKDG